MPNQPTIDKSTILRWLEAHPQAIGRDPKALLEHCEREVRRHAAEDAWLAAKEYVERKEHHWEREWGFPWVSEAFVARELCRRIARELARHEPHVEPGDEDHLVGEKVMEALDSQTRAMLGDWARLLASQVEHEVWERVVRFTKTHGRTLDRQGLLSHDPDPRSGHYYEKAAGVAHRLVGEYEVHAHPRPRAGSDGR